MDGMVVTLSTLGGVGFDVMLCSKLILQGGVLRLAKQLNIVLEISSISSIVWPDLLLPYACSFSLDTMAVDGGEGGTFLLWSILFSF